MWSLKALVPRQTTAQVLFDLSERSQLSAPTIESELLTLSMGR